jgi:DNA-binding LacI/PurR family transcriptional regulator
MNRHLSTKSVESPVATIRDLAAAAGLSVTTVSQVLNGKGDECRISEQTRVKVLETAARLGYRRNGYARALRTGRSNLIGIIGVNFDHPVPLLGARYTTRAVLERGYDVMLFDLTLHPGDPDRALKSLEGHRVEGLVAVTPPRYGREFISRVARRGAPVVTLDDIGVPEADVVQVDREEGARAATRHLLALGHRRIVLTVDRDAKASTLVARVRGYRRAHDEAGVAVDESLLLAPLNSYPSFADGVDIVPRVLEHPARPTALFCVNDRMAIGAMQSLYRAGVKVPDDLAVVGFDGIEEGEYTYVPLTTVAQPIAEAASQAVSLLIERLDRPDLKREPRRVVIPPRLVVRGSCGAPGADEGYRRTSDPTAGKGEFR